jgi:hypothetical protein
VVAKDVSRTGKVLVNFIQVMGAIKDVYTLEIPSMNVGFNFGAYFKMFNFDLIEMFGIPCLIDMTYYERYVGDMSVIIGLIVFVFLIYVIIFFILKARDSNGGKERRARGKLKGIMESTKRQKAALEKRLEELADVDTDSDAEAEGGGGKKGNGGASKVLGMFGAKAGPGGKISGLNRWTGLKKGLFSVQSIDSDLIFCHQVQPLLRTFLRLCLLRHFPSFRHHPLLLHHYQYQHLLTLPTAFQERPFAVSSTP